MLEGLEISEVKYSSLFKILDYRIESEYFLKKFQHIDNVLSRNKCVPFLQIFNYHNGRPYSSSEFSSFPIDKDCIHVAKIGDVTNNRFVDLWEYISNKEFQYQQGISLIEGDILMTLTGDPPDVGKVSYIHGNIGKSTWNQRVSRISLKHSDISPRYAYILLQNDYCRTQIERFAKGIRQRNLGNDGLENVIIPILPKDIQSKIDIIVLQALDCLTASRKSYYETEDFLLKTLGFTDFAVNPEASNIKSLKDSFLASGRFDSEYYLPKYEDYANLIWQYGGGADTFSNICEVKDRNFSPEAKKEYRYIELANVGKSGEVTGCSTMTGAELPSRARRIVHSGDVVISSLEGSIDSCALIPQEYDGALCSTGFYVIKSDRLNSETLLTLFKSLPVQQLMIRGCSGAIMSAISRAELDTIPLPLIHKDVQEEIAEHVQKSFALRQQAKNLLDEAKLTVENAILLEGGGKWLIYSGLQKQANNEFRRAMLLLLDNMNYPYCNTTQKKGVAHKSLSSSFAKNGRLDAEYYQPKYDILSAYLRNFPCSTIGKLTNIQKSVEPGSDAYQNSGIPFVRVQDLSKFGISETDKHLSEKDFSTVIRPKKDTILLSKDGSVGIAYKVEEDLNCITSGAILHLTVKNSNVLPDYLTLVLNSIVVKMQAERDAGGSVIKHWKPSEIQAVKVPILPIPIQMEISAKIQRSFALRKEGEKILHSAKSLVENVIANHIIK